MESLLFFFFQYHRWNKDANASWNIYDYQKKTTTFINNSYKIQYFALGLLGIFTGKICPFEVKYCMEIFLRIFFTKQFIFFIQLFFQSFLYCFAMFWIVTTWIFKSVIPPFWLLKFPMPFHSILVAVTSGLRSCSNRVMYEVLILGIFMSVLILF